MTAELLNAAEVAEYLGISAEQVQKRTRTEGWPCIKFSRKTIRYRPDHIEAIIAMHERQGTPLSPGVPGQTERSRQRSA